ncbi:MAG: phosphoenolpyruvate--protein phosphotransferase [Actinomycetota bacterium]|jgi:phosphotransferase system enzyme I (PtsI)
MAERFLVGAGVGSGVAHGTAFVLSQPEAALAQISKPGNRIGMIAIQKAMISVAEDLEGIATVGEAKEVMQALAMILRDPVLFDVLKAHLSEGAEAGDAIRRAFARFARQLEALGGYFAERAADLGYLANRVIAQLAGELPPVQFPAEPFILVTDSISPMDAVKLDPSRVLAVITSDGTPTSHSAIIIRAAKLPMVVGLVGSGLIRTGSDLLVDASSGQVFLDPSAERIEHYSTAANLDTQVIQLLEDDREAPVTLLANLGSSFEASAALAAGAKGVGLFRTELLYLGHREPPSLDEQFIEYSKLLSAFNGKRVLARVLDLDFDKPLPFLREAGQGKYANRGLQVLLANPEVLKTQLAALAKAQAANPNTDLWVMAPMVLSVQEAQQFASLARTAGLKRVGVMIEVPEVTEPGVIDGVIAAVDFISIGTNDLTHYTLGKSRHSAGEGAVAGTITLAETRSPAVLSIIERVILAAKAAGRPVGICGESASDPESARLFIELGADSLSASAALLPQLKAALLSAG